MPPGPHAALVMHPHRSFTHVRPVPQSVAAVQKQLPESKSHVLLAEQSLSSPHDPGGMHSPTDVSHASGPHVSAGALSHRGTHVVPEPPASAQR